jgi:hypothetical protein
MFAPLHACLTLLANDASDADEFYAQCTHWTLMQLMQPNVLHRVHDATQSVYMMLTNTRRIVERAPITACHLFMLAMRTPPTPDVMELMCALLAHTLTRAEALAIVAKCWVRNVFIIQYIFAHA